MELTLEMRNLGSEAIWKIAPGLKGGEEGQRKVAPSLDDD